MTGCSGELYVVFLWISNPIFYGFIFPDYFLNIFSYLYIPLCLRKSFKFMVLRLLENAFVSQKIESVNFHAFKQNYPLWRFLSSPLQAEVNYSFPRNNIFRKSVFPQQKKGRLMELKKWAKLILQENWSHVLMNSTIFAILTFLVSVSLCHIN